MLTVKPLATIGQEVVDLDVDAIDEASAAALRAVWRDAGMVLFRGIGTSPETLLALSRVFGEPEPHPIAHIRLPSHPDLILLTNKGGARGPIYAFDGAPTYGRIPWHTDLAFEITPNAGALLNMVERAERGGQTAWLDTTLAWEAMSPSLRRRLEGVEARFEFCSDLATMRFTNPGGVRVGESNFALPDYPPIVRPIVWRHPETGQPILNVCPLNIRSILGMAPAEGDALIEELIDAVDQPRFIYEHDWAEGDVILWDNYRMMHKAAGHPADVIRVVHRTTLRGRATAGRALTVGEDGVIA